MVVFWRDFPNATRDSSRISQWSNSLTSLTLHRSGIRGSLPSELWKLSKLRQLNLGALQLSGTISSQIGLMTNLQVLALQQNKFVGNIPTQLGPVSAGMKACVLGGAFDANNKYIPMSTNCFNVGE